MARLRFVVCSERLEAVGECVLCPHVQADTARRYSHLILFPRTFSYPADAVRLLGPCRHVRVVDFFTSVPFG
jgi:hypothetical protein